MKHTMTIISNVTIYCTTHLDTQQVSDMTVTLKQGRINTGGEAMETHYTERQHQYTFYTYDYFGIPHEHVLEKQD